MDTLSLSRPGASFFERTEARDVLEREVLPAFVPAQRWFGGKAREPQSFHVEEMLRFAPEENGARLILLRVEYAAGEPELYLLPALLGPREGAEVTAVIAEFDDGFALLDALEDNDRRAELLRLIRTETTVGELAGVRGSVFDPNSDLENKSRQLKVEQSNSSIAYGDTIFLKLFRKPEAGINPDVEITRFLSEKAHAHNVPPFFGAIEWRQPGAEPRVLGAAVGMVGNRGDAWAYALDEVGQYFTRLPDDKSHAQQSIADSLMGECGERIAQLARRTAEVHLALASDDGDPVFAPEPFTADDQKELSAGIVQSAEEMFALLAKQQVEGEMKELLEDLAGQKAKVVHLARAVAEQPVATAKTRAHGDYHLGQVLNTGDDFVIIDFEGEPRRTLAERKAKRSPLRDVAGMLRSFHYAAHSALERVPEEDRHDYEIWAEYWSAAASRIFKDAWLETCKGAPFLPAEPADRDRLLNAFLLEKAIYEVMYELNHRPNWVPIPVRGVLALVRPEGKPEPAEAAVL